MCLFGEQPAGSPSTLILPDLVPPAHPLSPGSPALVPQPLTLLETHGFMVASCSLAGGTGDPHMLVEQAKVPEDPGMESSL